MDRASEIGQLTKGPGFRETKKAARNLQILGNREPLRDRLPRIAALAADASSPDLALNNLERIAAVLSDEALAALGQGDRLEALVRLCGGSPALVSLVIKEPALLNPLISGDVLEQKGGDEARLLAALREWTQGVADFKDLCARLRRFRHREVLRIGLRDLTGRARLEETVEALSDLASACLQVAYELCQASLIREYGVPRFRDPEGDERESQFVILGLGKLGGRELNFSSDIDLLYLYTSDRGETAGGAAGRTLPLPQFYAKLADLVTRAIGEVTEDGWVFRVDLRLRPEGGKGNLANSLRSAEIYYESWGQTWERAVFLKARPVAGDQELGQAFLRMMEPFVYRRYLDYATVEEIREMKAEIDRQAARQEAQGKDVKLGVGGIREIEFFVQALQLINGGKDPALRGANTLWALETLTRRGHLSEEDRSALRAAYIFLRQVEHKIQIVHGRQTHRLPQDPQEIQELARRLGYRDDPQGEASVRFLHALEEHSGRVHATYRQLFYQPEEEARRQTRWELADLLREEIGEEELRTHLQEYGFRDPERARRHLLLLRDGRPYTHLPLKGKRLLKRIAPLMFSEIVASPDPDGALANLEEFLSGVGARITFLALLAENPRVIQLLVRLFGGSDYLARLFVRHPELLDSLVRSDSAALRRSREELYRELSSLVGGEEDYEEVLDILRRFRNAELLRIGTNDLYGALSRSQQASQISRLADVCLQVAYEMGCREMQRRYGRPFYRDEQGRLREARMAIIGLGKLGGEEMNYNSDLDVIFIYSGPGESRGPGVRSLSNHEYFVRLAQQIITALSCLTKDGYVFKLDTRLRPSGNAGPLVSSLNSFWAYHQASSQIWERQVLLKSRLVAGDWALGGRTLGLIRSFVYRAPLSLEEAREIHRLRMRMEHELAHETSETFNLKLGRGGLVDIQFIVQLLQLRHGAHCRQVRQRHTLRALDGLSRAGFLPAGEYDRLVEAWDFLERLGNKLRIAQDRSLNEIVDRPEVLEALARRLSSGELHPLSGKELLEEYKRHTEQVRQIYLRYFQ
ncbi:MAG: bifunctional [glutamate--ammonia ligase]-adenylyl-L-tyrosine phosphorylase/[glutamate--ammonia-ligase] adenylyltransferase [Candidatus Tectomicrobia bacterium]|uniref:Bifunctional [glutamate--ammonia ligase]-adenylyl-L-tyrosine phosphorylase/[glutamate--ammonia-ligase] adenylyltransferase n=1 Tax=Tectimicrobiota bacterium TaxID=2528274 RepID=A0A932FYX1_UNCTE|nr:bifunctional [glutamate--ammonia ligase]-adenylyl-L-tyrosine phosphorylase/[glutamate--ammonia-ligase] adenylyltransferase [Candidatus Tectomicrobia bacterium]